MRKAIESFLAFLKLPNAFEKEIKGNKISKSVYPHQNFYVNLIICDNFLDSQDDAPSSRYPWSMDEYSV